MFYSVIISGIVSLGKKRGQNDIYHSIIFMIENGSSFLKAKNRL